MALRSRNRPDRRRCREQQECSDACHPRQPDALDRGTPRHRPARGAPRRARTQQDPTAVLDDRPTQHSPDSIARRPTLATLPSSNVYTVGSTPAWKSSARVRASKRSFLTFARLAGSGYHPAMFRRNQARWMRGAHVTTALFVVLVVAGCGGGTSTGSTHSIPAGGATPPTATSTTPTAAKATSTGAAAGTGTSTSTSPSSSQSTPSTAKTTSTSTVTGRSATTGPGASQIPGLLSKQQLAKDCIKLLAERSLPKQERTEAAKLCENIAKR
jgi:hypothetical protein